MTTDTELGSVSPLSRLNLYPNPFNKHKQYFLFALFTNPKKCYNWLIFLIQELEAKCTAIVKSLESDNDEGSSGDEKQGERISKRRKTVDEMETEIS